MKQQNETLLNIFANVFRITHKYTRFVLIVVRTITSRSIFVHTTQYIQILNTERFFSKRHGIPFVLFNTMYLNNSLVGIYMVCQITIDNKIIHPEIISMHLTYSYIIKLGFSFYVLTKAYIFIFKNIFFRVTKKSICKQYYAKHDILKVYSRFIS